MRMVVHSKAKTSTPSISYYRSSLRLKAAQLDQKVLNLFGVETAPVALLLYIMLNTLENITNKIAVVHAKEVCKLCGLPPAGLE